MIKNFRNHTPNLHPSVFVAENATVIGRVKAEEKVSIWYSTVIRGDVNEITIGEGTNIQDLVMIHCAHDHPTKIGKGVTIGHSAIVHGCTLGDNVLIGMGAKVLDGAIVGDNTLIGAGSLIPPGKVIPANALVMGVPGKVIRTLNEEEIEQIKVSAAHYVALADETKGDL